MKRLGRQKKGESSGEDSASFELDQRVEGGVDEMGLAVARVTRERGSGRSVGGADVVDERIVMMVCTFGAEMERVCQRRRVQEPQWRPNVRHIPSQSHSSSCRVFVTIIRVDRRAVRRFIRTNTSLVGLEIPSLSLLFDWRILARIRTDHCI